MANIEDVSHLLEVMKQLRDPVEGCAWDLEQDHDSLIPYLEEESQELIEAIESKNSDNIKEELVEDIKLTEEKVFIKKYYLY